MSKLIVEMDMPKACSWVEDGVKKRCPMTEWGGACAVTKLFEPFGDKRPSWCPIKGVMPDEHGDLIDRDELKEKKVYSHERHEYVVPVACIDWQDAVIAAERKDDEQIH